MSFFFSIKTMENSNNKQQFSIDLPADIAEGTYSNLAVISHSNKEFIIDFIRVMPGMPKGKVKSRIILTPEHAKNLFNALQDNIKKFEQVNGPIKETSDFPITTMGSGSAQA